MRSFPLVHYLPVQLICVLLVKARTKVLKFSSLFSIACALFHFPYPLCPLLATLTKTAGCIPTIPKLELLTSLPRAKPRGYSFTQSGVCEGAPYSSSFFSHSCALFCAFLHSPKTQPFYFQAIPHSFHRNRGVGGTPLPVLR